MGDIIVSGIDATTGQSRQARTGDTLVDADGGSVGGGGGGATLLTQLYLSSNQSTGTGAVKVNLDSTLVDTAGAAD